MHHESNQKGQKVQTIPRDSEVSRDPLNPYFLLDMGLLHMGGALRKTLQLKEIWVPGLGLGCLADGLPSTQSLVPHKTGLVV